MKGKIKVGLKLLSITFFFFLLLFVWIFPFSDLSDFVTDQISTATQGQVFIQFGDLDFGFIPTLSVTGEDVLIETASLPPIPVQRFTIWPGLMSAISAARNPGQLPHFSADAKGLFGGDLEASLSSGKGTDEINTTLVRFEGENLNLDKVATVAQLPLSFKGKVNLKGQVDFDPSFRLQPEGELQVRGNSIQIPPGNVPSQMGPIFLPGFSWSELILQGRASGGSVYIEEGTLGKAGDSLFARIKGQMGMPIGSQGAQLNSFDLRVDLQVNPALAKELGTFLGFIDRFKVGGGPNSRYIFRAVSNSPGAPPNLLPLSSF